MSKELFFDERARDDELLNYEKDSKIYEQTFNKNKMETKKSKVKTISFKSEYPKDNPTTFYFNIEFENGDKGQFSTNKREQTKFKEGAETEYTIKEVEKNGFKNIQIDTIKKEFNGVAKKSFDPEFEARKQQLIIRQSSISTSFDFIKNKEKLTSTDAFNLAEKIVQWVNAPFEKIQ